MEKNLSIGKACNNNCIFCGATGNYNSLYSYDKVVSELEKGVKEGATQLYIEGREPTIVKDFIKILKKAKVLGYKEITLITNGRRFSNPLFTKAVAPLLSKVFISVHGHNKDLHDSLTRVNGSFNQLLLGIEELKNNNFTNVAVSTVIVKHNLKFLPEIVKTFFSNGIKEFEFSFLVPQGKALNNFSKLAPKLADAVDPLIKSLEICKTNNILLGIRYFPYCISNKLTKNIKMLNNPNLNKTMVCIESVCSFCKYNNLCFGYWNEYIRQYGSDEFSAVRNNE